MSETDFKCNGCGSKYPHRSGIRCHLDESNRKQQERNVPEIEGRRERSRRFAGAKTLSSIASKEDVTDNTDLLAPNESKLIKTCVSVAKGSKIKAKYVKSTANDTSKVVKGNCVSNANTRRRKKNVPPPCDTNIEEETDSTSMSQVNNEITFVEIAATEEINSRTNDELKVEEQVLEVETEMTGLNIEIVGTVNEVDMLQQNSVEHRIKQGSNKSSKRRKRQIPVCGECGMRFSSMSNLTRHLAVVHERKKNPIKLSENPFACPLCAVKFTNKGNMKRHLHSVHDKHVRKDTHLIRYCTQCDMSFQTTSSLKRHMDYKHSDNPPRYICNKCHKTFSTSYNLIRHNEDIHPVNRKIYACGMCDKKYSRKDKLCYHIDHKHDTLNVPFICALCNGRYSSKRSVRRHIINLHLNAKFKHTENVSIKCLLCGEICVRKAFARDHYQRRHSIDITYEEHFFPAIADFRDWKTKVERRTACYFIQTYCHKGSEESVTTLSCHRSGVYKGKSNDRLRLEKECGSKKLNGYCPAEMDIRVNNVDGTVKLSFQKTHVGHAIADEMELGYVYLNKEERQMLASKIAEGMSFEQILRESHEMARINEDEYSKLSVLTRKDLYNIALANNLKNVPPREETESPMDIDLFIKQNKKLVIYYKPEDKEDLDGNFLTTDIVMMIMSEAQKKVLQQHGSKMVLLVGIPMLSTEEYTLHTLLVIDDENEGTAVAFCLTNRNDEYVIDVFLQCVREQAGPIHSNVVMTDLNDTYCRSWTKTMSEPKSHLYCPWQVRDAWAKNLRKIANKDKKESMRKRLHDLSLEVNQEMFAQRLDDIVNDADPDVIEFVDYFRSEYLNNYTSWASCYSNMNSSAETLHRTIRTKISRVRKMNSLLDCMKMLIDYQEYKQATSRTKKIRGSALSKLQVLRKRHRRACQYFEESSSMLVETGDTFKWQIGFFCNAEENIMEVYTVEKLPLIECANNAKPCQLICKPCKICLHEYRCGCQDSFVNNNMCKHIHALGIYLQSGTPEDDGKMEENTAFISTDEIISDEIDQLEVDDEDLENPIEENEEETEFEEEQVIHMNIDDDENLQETYYSQDESYIEVENIPIEGIIKQDEEIIVKSEDIMEQEEIHEIHFVAPPENVMSEKKKLLAEFEAAMAEAKSLQDVREVRSKFIKPIIPTLRAKRVQW